MGIRMFGCFREPERQTAKIRSTIAAPCTEFVQQGNSLQQAWNSRERAGTQQLRLGTFPTVGQEPAPQSRPAFVPCDVSSIDRFRVRICIIRSCVTRVSLSIDSQQWVFGRLEVDQQLSNLARAVDQVPKEPLQVMDQPRLETHDGRDLGAL